MKRSFAVGMVGLALAFAPGVAAQQEPIGAGSLLIGGSASISGSHEDGADSSSFSLALEPTIGVFVVRGLALQAALSVVYNTLGSTSAHSWGIGPEVAYYFGGVSPRLYPFVRVRTLYTWGSFSNAGAVLQAEGDSRRISLRPSAGAVVMLVPYAGIKGELFFERRWFTAEARASSPQPTELSTERQTSVYGLSFGIEVFVF